MLSYLSRNLPEAQRQQRRKRAARLSVAITFLIAIFSTLDAWPDASKPMRPVVIVQLVATWIAVIMTAWIVPFLQRRRRQKRLHGETTQRL